MRAGCCTKGRAAAPWARESTSSISSSPFRRAASSSRPTGPNLGTSSTACAFTRSHARSSHLGFPRRGGRSSGRRNAGRVLHERACGRPVGTRVDVEHLFEPVPARRKFLKTDRTESGHIVNCVRLYALACPAVSFALYEEGREVFRSPECSSLSDRVAEIFVRQAAEGLLPIDFAESGMHLAGLIGRPGVGRATRHDMVAFVNSRPVDSRTLNGALIESYRESIPQGRYPVAYVFLECGPHEIDVNVHPAKREVRFRKEALVRGFVIRAVLTGLRQWTRRGAADGIAAAAPTFLGDPGPLPAPFHPWAGEPAQSAALARPAAAPSGPDRK